MVPTGSTPVASRDCWKTASLARRAAALCLGRGGFGRHRCLTLPDRRRSLSGADVASIGSPDLACDRGAVGHTLRRIGRLDRHADAVHRWPAGLPVRSRLLVGEFMHRRRCGLRNSRSFANFQPVVERWDGTSWQVTSPSSQRALLDGISCPQPSVCFAVGSTDSQPLIELWDGSSWSIQASAPGVNGALADVSCSGLLACTAVGVATGKAGPKHNRHACGALGRQRLAPAVHPEPHWFGPAAPFTASRVR